MKKKLMLIIMITIIIICVISIGIDKIKSNLQLGHREFIYCRLINRGMTKEEVFEQLQLVGEFEESFKDDSQYLDLSRIHFRDPYLKFITGGDTIIAYEDGKVLLRYYYTSVSDRFYFCEEEKQDIYGSQ